MVVLSTIPPQTRYSASWPVDLSSGVVSHTSTTSIKESLQTKPTDAQKLKIIMEEITRVANSLSRHGFAIPEGEVKLDTLLWDSDGIKGYFDDSTGITDLLLSLDKRIPGFNFYKHLPTNATPQSILDITNGKVRIGTLGEGHGRSVFLSLMETDGICPGVMVTSDKGSRVLEDDGRNLICDLSGWPDTKGDQSRFVESPLAELTKEQRLDLMQGESNKNLLLTGWGKQLKEFVERFRDLDLNVYYRPVGDLIGIIGNGIDLDPVYFAGKNFLVRALQALGVDSSPGTKVQRLMGVRKRRDKVAA